MNLLASALYDPAGAVTKATTSLLAMTAIDTSNLRLSVTVPAHGKVWFRIRVKVGGSSTAPLVLLGVMTGATVVGKVVPTGSNQNAEMMEAEFVATGLTPGATNFDAAYSVIQTSASTSLRYGGPNDTSGTQSGGFVFEAWDPQPLKAALDGGVSVTQWNGTNVSTPATAGVPEVNVKNINNVAAATPGAAGGVLISGSNSGTTTLGALTITGATTMTGNVSMAAGLTITQSTVDGHGFAVTGNGAGAGLRVVGGATGIGFNIVGGATSGDGIKVTTTSGHGVNLAPVGTNMHGFLSTGGNGGTSDGMKLAAGTGGVDLRANRTGNLTGTVATVTAVTGLTASNLDAAISSRMASYTQPTGFLAATFPGTVASTTNITAGTITTVTTVTNQLTAAAIATGIWQDATAGDFTAASSIGKSIMNGVALGTGLTVARCTLTDTLTTYTGNTLQTGDSFARIGVAGAGLTNVVLPSGGLANVTAWTVNVTGNLSGSVGSVTGRVTANTDQLAGQTVTAAAGVTFPSSIASPTNITAGTLTTATNLTNLPAAPTDWLSAASISAAGVTKIQAGLSTYAGGDTSGTATLLARIPSFPSNFASLGINASGHVSRVTLADTTTTNTDMRGTDNAALAAGVLLAASQSLYAPAKAGDAMTLTSGERTAVANEVEAQIIDETDSEKVLTAITDKIASVDPDLGGLSVGAIASAVWASVTRSLTDKAGFSLATAPPTATDTATAVRTELAAELARIDAATSTRAPAVTALSSAVWTDTKAGYLNAAISGVGAEMLKLDWTGLTGEASFSVLNALRFVRVGFSIAGSTMTVFKEDGVTPAFTRTLTSDPDAEPITGIS